VKLARRDLLKLGAAGLLVPTQALAAAGDRRLLTVFCPGGWDVAWALAPLHDNPNVDSDPDSEPAQAGTVSYVHSDARLAVSDFFELYWERICLLHGLELRSVTHDNCRRMLLTGANSAVGDDWGAVIGGHARDLALPHVVVSGPGYAAEHISSVGRVGSSGQLQRLMDGSALERSDQAARALPGAADALVSSWLDQQLRGGSGGDTARFHEGYRGALVGEETVRGLDIELTGGSSFLEQAQLALDCFELGLSRSAMVEHRGRFDLAWDSHGGNSIQGDHFDELFTDLRSVMEELEDRGMLETTTVVVCSEMGRFPLLNAGDGKDHWTWTSALLFGAGVAGGQVIGGYDEAVAGLPVTLDSGARTLTGAHLGATLLTLMDVDPEPWLGAEAVPDVLG
jgi:hypothetical protein